MIPVMNWTFLIIFSLTTTTITSIKYNETLYIEQLTNNYSLSDLIECIIKPELKLTFNIMNNLTNNYLCLMEDMMITYTNILNSDRIHIWIMSVISSCLIGITSMFPLILISNSKTNCLINNDSSSKTILKYLLSFAVGGLLGDVFLHLLPEASNQILKSGMPMNSVQMYLGFWILCGIFSFGLIEVIFSHINRDEVEIDNHLVNGFTNLNGNNGHIKNGFVKHDEDNDTALSEMNVKSNHSTKINITGYLNLLANGFDNLTHGLAVGASFLVSIKMGLLTTFAIIIHEIPHEIGDFAILIKSGFNKWDAVKAQVLIACVTIFGSIIILCADSADVIGVKTAWILPFTSGGFLHIALVSILPDLLIEHNLNESLKQAFFIACGITVMAIVNLIGE